MQQVLGRTEVTFKNTWRPLVLGWAVDWTCYKTGLSYSVSVSRRGNPIRLSLNINNHSNCMKVYIKGNGTDCMWKFSFIWKEKANFLLYNCTLLCDTATYWRGHLALLFSILQEFKTVCDCFWLDSLPSVFSTCSSTTKTPWWQGTSLWCSYFGFTRERRFK